ncbi:hypothetical protein KJ980_04440 [Patescibacteria group bacterium]|nr:hypothetical protein [Patescibacteria group bacterium]MBU4015937.1 hypothetical protein [Patescibacteria group bacterium]MBU4098872.1 hypothetical protein [Patescibacteria group bacterium]
MKHKEKKKEIPAWDKIIKDINACNKHKNNVSVSFEKVERAEEKCKELYNIKSSPPEIIVEAKRNLAETKNTLQEKCNLLQKRTDNLKNNLPSLLTNALGKESAGSLIHQIQEGLEEHFIHYNADTTELASIFSEKTNRTKEKLEGRPMEIGVWSRDTENLYAGNEAPCCISIENATPGHPEKSTIADYLTDLGMQIVEILDKVTKSPITACWCWPGEGGELKTALVASNIESNTLYSSNFSDQLADKLLAYIKEYSNNIKTGKAVLGMQNNDFPTKTRLDKMTSDNTTYTKIGGCNRKEGYHFEAQNKEVKVI